MSDRFDSFPFISLLSGWGVVSGPGLFMLRSLVSGISTATVAGVSSGMIGSMIWGTAGLPFLIGSSLGFAFGSYRWYEVATREAMVQLELYPALLQMHIASNFPWVSGLHSRKRDWYTAETFRRSWVMKSMLVVGWLSAESSLREIRERIASTSKQRLPDAFILFNVSSPIAALVNKLTCFSLISGDIWSGQRWWLLIGYNNNASC